MLRRMAGCPIRGENYFLAEIAAGRVGIDQPPPRQRFKSEVLQDESQDLKWAVTEVVVMTMALAAVLHYDSTLRRLNRQSRGKLRDELRSGQDRVSHFGIRGWSGSRIR